MTARTRPAGHDDRRDRSAVRAGRRARAAARTPLHRRALERGAGVDARGRQRAVERHPERPDAALVGARRHARMARERRIHQRPYARPRRHDLALQPRIARGVPHAADGSAQRIVVDRWQGKRFNAPNDIVVKSDGTIWFTDPPYGLIIPEEGHGGRFRDRRLLRVPSRSARAARSIAVTDLPIEPNGLAFSPDERALYVSDTSAALGREDTGKHCIWAFDVVDGTSPGERTQVRGRGARRSGRVPRRRAGLDLHELGGQRAGVRRRTARCSGRIAVPEKVGNVTFGGPQRDTLYIAASTSLYRIRLATRGVQRP